MKIIIGITTYNRISILRKMLTSLLSSKTDDYDCTIRVYDDCSSEYGMNELKDLFPPGTFIYRSEVNRGSDYNIGLMYRDFLSTDGDVLFNCDSDLLFNESWLIEGIRLLAETDGIVSLFNTANHPSEGELEELVIKSSVGSAGTLMTREIVELICENISEKDMYASLDFNWCNLLRKKGKRILCSKRSYVQHVGFCGFNSDLRGVDYGEGFEVGGQLNGQLINDALLEALTERKDVVTDPRIFLYLFPFDRVAMNSNVVIYGAGRVGKDYLEQAEMTGYCKSIMVVDQNYEKYENVYPPESLKKIECDYVIVAAHFATIRNEMVDNILRINRSLMSKLVDDVCYTIRIG